VRIDGVNTPMKVPSFRRPLFGPRLRLSSLDMLERFVIATFP
jgi:hypothetical protein